MHYQLAKLPLENSTVYKVLVAFLKYFKSCLLAFEGGSPPAPLTAPRGAGLSARRLCKIIGGSFAKTNSVFKNWKKIVF